MGSAVQLLRTLHACECRNCCLNLDHERDEHEGCMEGHLHELERALIPHGYHDDNYECMCMSCCENERHDHTIRDDRFICLQSDMHRCGLFPFLPISCGRIVHQVYEVLSGGARRLLTYPHPEVELDVRYETYDDEEEEAECALLIPASILACFGEDIVVEAFMASVEEMQLPRAVNLLTTSRRVLQKIYYRVFGEKGGRISAVELHRRLSRTLLLLMEVHDIWEDGAPLQTPCLQSVVLPCSDLFDVLTMDLHPWTVWGHSSPYDRVYRTDMMSQSPRLVRDDDEAFYVKAEDISCTTFNYDLHEMQHHRTINYNPRRYNLHEVACVSAKPTIEVEDLGEGCRRSFHKFFCLPALFLNFGMRNDLLPPMSYYTWNQSFRGFASLLKSVWGRHTGIFVRIQVPDTAQGVDRLDHWYVEL